MADEMRLRQVLLNLLNNALKYSPEGTDVEIAADAEEGRIKVGMRDHGLGIPLADQERLFERFTRLDRDINSPVRGAGLGLYICKQLVWAMGGQIEVESAGQSGDGSLFSFTLQIASELPQEKAYLPSDVSVS
jgi:signal transduction histidine kinase